MGEVYSVVLKLGGVDICPLGEGFVQLRAEAVLLIGVLHANFLPMKSTFRVTFFILLYSENEASLAVSNQNTSLQ